MIELSFDDDGLPTRESSEQLDAREWAAWIRSRTGNLDSLTGEVLHGHPDPLGIFREIAFAVLDTSETSERLLAGALLAAGTGLREWKSAKTVPAAERALITLSQVLSLLSSFPLKTLRLTHPLVKARAQEIYEQIVLRNFLEVPKEVLPQLTESIARFLNIIDFQIEERILFQLMDRASAASEALALAFKLHPNPEEKARFFAHFAAARLQAENVVLLELVIEQFAKEGEVRSLLQMASNLLSAEQREQLMKLPFAARHLESLTIRDVLKRARFDWSYMGFNGGWSNQVYNWINVKSFRYRKPAEVPGFILKLAEGAREELKRYCKTGDLAFHRARAKGTWDGELLSAIQDSILSCDCAFLDERRALFMNIVPYAYVKEFAIVFVDVPSRRGEISATVELWAGKTLTDTLVAYEHTFEVGFISGTVASSELDDCAGAAKRGLGDASEDAVALARWLAEEPQSRIGVVDLGFVPLISAIYRRGTELHSFTTSDLQGGAIKKVNIRYRRPVLAGVPFRRDDHVWGGVLSEVVDRVFFREEKIHEANLDASIPESDMGKADLPCSIQLIASGLIPLKPGVLEALAPWVGVSGEFVPATLKGFVPSADSARVLKFRGGEL